jgi:hypothetical protein
MRTLRKTAIILLTAGFFLTLGDWVWLELSYTSRLPGAPDLRAGRTNRIVVNHGFVRYAARPEVRRLHRANVAFWCALGGALVAGLLNLHYKDFAPPGGWPPGPREGLWPRNRG